MERSMLEDLPTLSKEIDWGPIRASFSLMQPPVDERLVSNISIIPFIKDQCVIIQADNGRWELPGGTLEPGEHYMDGLKREVLEELGGELLSYTVFGRFDCRSLAAEPFRPHIPHPRFIRLVGYGEVKLVGAPLNPPDGEQVTVVDVVDIEEAVSRLEANDRYDIAELYKLAYRMRETGRSDRIR